MKSILHNSISFVYIKFRCSNNAALSFDALSRAILEQQHVCHPLVECLKLDWPHAIGKDDKGPLVWKTKAQDNWFLVITELARIKIAFRTGAGNFSFAGKADGQLAGLHVLAYPVTHHAVSGWIDMDNSSLKKDKRGYYIQSERLANQLRFKLARREDGKLEGIIVHLPCKVPDELVNKLSPEDRHFIDNNELAVWQRVHNILDNQATRLK